MIIQSVAVVIVLTEDHNGNTSVDLKNDFENTMNKY
jgi:hypothetical protein